MNELLRPVNLVLPFLPGLLVGVTLFLMRDTSKINTGEVFSGLFMRCLDYVESRIDFDTTGLEHGGLRADMNRTIERDPDRNLYREPKELYKIWRQQLFQGCRIPGWGCMLPGLKPTCLKLASSGELNVNNL